MPKEPSIAMKHLTAELDAIYKDETLSETDLFRRRVELLERYLPQMTIEERVETDGGFYIREEPTQE
jgi:hypothetical protein